MRRLFISAALVLLAALSCSKSEQRSYYSDPDAVHFSAGVSSDTKTSPIGSEAEQTKFNIGDKIAISDGGAFFTYVLGTEGWAPENPSGSGTGERRGRGRPADPAACCRP